MNEQSTVLPDAREGGLSHRPARCPRGMVGGCRPQTVRRQPIRRWTASSRSRSRSPRKILLVPSGLSRVRAPTPIVKPWAGFLRPPTANRFLPLNSAISHRGQAKNGPRKIALFSTRVEIQNSTRPTPSPNLARAPFLPTVGFPGFRFLEHPPVAPRSEECRPARLAISPCMDMSNEIIKLAPRAAEVGQVGRIISLQHVVPDRAAAPAALSPMDLAAGRVSDSGRYPV